MPNDEETIKRLSLESMELAKIHLSKLTAETHCRGGVDLADSMIKALNLIDWDAKEKKIWSLNDVLHILKEVKSEWKKTHAEHSDEVAH